MKLSADRTTRPSKRPRPRTSTRGNPAWDIALLFPRQGAWTADEYLALENSGNRLIEWIDGVIEVLPMPDLFHQRILQYLFEHLRDFVRTIKLGEVLFAPLPVRLGEKEMREPDVILLKPHRIKDVHKPPEGADLVMEIVSPGKENRQRDISQKRKAYGKARIPEYWIVDPEKNTITVLTLSGKTYKVHGEFKPGEQATSKLLPGFSVDVSEVFAAGQGA